MILNEKGDKGEGECLSFDSYDKGKVSVSVSILTIRVIRIETGTLTFAFITLLVQNHRPLHFCTIKKNTWYCVLYCISES